MELRLGLRYWIGLGSSLFTVDKDVEQNRLGLRLS